MKKETTARELLAALALSATVLSLPMEVHAQVNPEIANCAELKDEATRALFELCTAHTGCRFVLNVQKTCARAKSYLERLQTAIGEGTKTLFGYRKEVTPDAVFTAVLGTDEMQKQRSLGGRSGVQKEAQEIASRVREVGNGDTLTGAYDRGTRPWVYYGQTSGGKADGIGTRIYSDGEIQRGQTMSDTLAGPGEVLSKSGNRFVGKYSELGSGQRTGVEFEQDSSWFNGVRWNNGETNGTYTRADGTYFLGLRDSRGARVQGRENRADNSLVEEGRYEGNVLSVGTRYDTAGVATTINIPAERQAAAREAAEKTRLAAEVEQQRKREAAAQAEQQFRASLQTMNPGQLFAKADELNAQGDRTRAREAQRALMSRFPDHALTATVARQMAGESGGPSGASDSGSGRNSAGGRFSSQRCEALRKSVTTTRIPPNASITASQETVMFMTKTVLDMIAGGCPTDGTTPAQIEAERAERQRQYTAAENACNQVQSGGRRCVPQAHSVSETVQTPSVTPTASTSQQSGGPRGVYDPVTGRCLPEDSCECQQTCNVPRGSSSGGGGIRTAR